MKDDKTTVLKTYYALSNANFVKNALEQNNIPCFLSNEITNQILYGLEISGIDLHVFEKDIEKANDILSELEIKKT